jgi:hypothetical protein
MADALGVIRLGFEKRLPCPRLTEQSGMPRGLPRGASLSACPAIALATAGVSVVGERLTICRDRIH